MPHQWLGIDLGGTHLRAGIVRDGTILAQQKAVVGSDRDVTRIVARIATLREGLCAAHGPVAGAGAGIPGLVASATGVVHRAPHYPSWGEQPIAAQLQAALGVPCVVDNDANLIALGESAAGAGRALRQFCMITIGTGLGGGIVVDGRLWQGASGFAGEIGHLVIAMDGDPCPCGGRGHWEGYVSASGLPRLLGTIAHPDKAAFLQCFNNDARAVTFAECHRLATAGDAFARALWERFGEYFGAGIAGLANVLGIDDFVIGGGVSPALEWFRPATQRSIAARTYPTIAARIRLHAAQLGDAAGLLGAAALCRQRLANPGEAS